MLFFFPKYNKTKLYIILTTLRGMVNIVGPRGSQNHTVPGSEAEGHSIVLEITESL